MSKIQASITFSVDDNDEILLDVAIDDWSDKSIDRFATVLASLSTLQIQTETLTIVKSYFNQHGKDKEFETLVFKMLSRSEAILEKYQEDAEKLEEEPKDSSEDDPFIKPTDMV